MKALIIAILLIPCLSLAWDTEKNLIQGIEAYADELRLKSVYQVGSQVYIQIELWDDPNTVHTGTPILFSRELELQVPSFMALLTEKDPIEDSIILYQNDQWLADYEIEAENSLVLTNDMKGVWDVVGYPWVFNEEYGWYYVTPIASIDVKEGPVLPGSSLSSRYSRWIYKHGFGWLYKFDYHPLFPDSR
jgi:hypothetical protein